MSGACAVRECPPETNNRCMEYWNLATAIFYVRTEFGRQSSFARDSTTCRCTIDRGTYVAYRQKKFLHALMMRDRMHGGAEMFFYLIIYLILATKLSCTHYFAYIYLIK